MYKKFQEKQATSITKVFILLHISNASVTLQLAMLCDAVAMQNCQTSPHIA